MAKKPGNWLQAVQKRIEEKGTKGATHKYLGVPEDKSIPMSKLNAALKKRGLKPKTKKRLQFAKNMATLAARRKAHAQQSTASTLDILTAIANEQGLELAGAAAAPEPERVPVQLKELAGEVQGIRYRFLPQDSKPNGDVGYIGAFQRWSGKSRTEREQALAYLLVFPEKGKAELGVTPDASKGHIRSIVKLVLNAKRYIGSVQHTDDITEAGLTELIQTSAKKFAADPKFWYADQDRTQLRKWGRADFGKAEAATLEDWAQEFGLEIL